MKRAHFYRFTNTNGDRFLKVSGSLMDAIRSLPEEFRGTLACMVRKPVVLSSDPMNKGVAK